MNGHRAPGENLLAALFLGMALYSGSSHVLAKKATATGYLTFKVWPATAIVKLGRDVVPLAKRERLARPSGSYEVTVSGVGATKIETVEVVAGQTSVVVVTLEPQPGESITNGIGMRLAWVPAGSFDMGSPAGEEGRLDDEGPVHHVTLARGFWMGACEVTQAQYRAVTGYSPSKFQGPRRPVEQVSWDDAREFCRLLTERDGTRYRLPSEAEWEYACRAGTVGTSHGSLSSVAWLDQGFGGTTHEVGLKEPNAFGLHDMLGNVWEWCADGYHGGYRGAPTDGSAWAGGEANRVNRGGCWNSHAVNCRAANRNRYTPESTGYDLGFRVVVEGPP